MPEKCPLTESGEKEEPGILGEDACSVRGLPEVEGACRTVHLLMKRISKGRSSAPYPSGRSMTHGVICHKVEEEFS